MAWKTTDNPALGIPAFQPTTPDTTPQTAIGTIAKAYDDVLGVGEFIYLPGVANTVAGDLVSYDLLPAGQVTTRLVAGAGVTNSGRSVAAAVAAIGAGQYGWYQIGGLAVINAIAATAVGPAYASATAGQVTSVAAAGTQIAGARISSAVGTPSAGKSYATLSRPHMQTQIT